MAPPSNPDGAVAVPARRRGERPDVLPADGLTERTPRTVQRVHNEHSGRVPFGRLPNTDASDPAMSTTTSNPSSKPQPRAFARSALMQRWATPLTTGLFVVSAVSGVALFFHWQSGAFHAMHEWLSMALLVPFVLHVWKNWGAIMAYLRRGVMLPVLLLSVVAAVPFAWSALQGGGGAGGNPSMRAARLLMDAPLSTAAPVFGASTEQLVQRLEAAGYTVTGPEDTLAGVASVAGAEPNRVLATLMAGPRH